MTFLLFEATGPSVKVCTSFRLKYLSLTITKVITLFLVRLSINVTKRGSYVSLTLSIKKTLFDTIL